MGASSRVCVSPTSTPSVSSSGIAGNRMPHRSIVEGAPFAESVFQRPAAGYYISNCFTFSLFHWMRMPGSGVNSPLAILKSDSLNRRELTFKALAGLVGGAIGWFPVELASHNSHLGQVQTTGE